MATSFTLELFINVGLQHAEERGVVISVTCWANFLGEFFSFDVAEAETKLSYQMAEWLVRILYLHCNIECRVRYSNWCCARCNTCFQSQHNKLCFA